MDSERFMDVFRTVEEGISALCFICTTLSQMLKFKLSAQDTYELSCHYVLGNSKYGEKFLKPYLIPIKSLLVLFD